MTFSIASETEDPERATLAAGSGEDSDDGESAKTLGTTNYSKSSDEGSVEARLDRKPIVQRRVSLGLVGLQPGEKQLSVIGQQQGQGQQQQNVQLYQEKQSDSPIERNSNSSGRTGVNSSSSSSTNPHPWDNTKASSIYCRYGMDPARGLTLNISSRNKKTFAGSSPLAQRMLDNSSDKSHPQSTDRKTFTPLAGSNHKQSFASAADMSGVKIVRLATGETKSVRNLGMHGAMPIPREGSASSLDTSTDTMGVPQRFVGLQSHKHASMHSLLSELTGEDHYRNLQFQKSTTQARLELLAATPKYAKCEPNHPQSSLEFPLLHFLTSGSSSAITRMVDSFFRYRWSVSYPLQRRVPLSRAMRKLNIFLTWGELLLILPFFVCLVIGSVYSFMSPSVAISGQTSRTPLIFCFGTAMRNSYLTLLLGIPFERALWYHKLSARLAYLNGIFHTYVAFFYPNHVEQPPLFSFTGPSPSFFRYLFLDDVNTGGTLLLFSMTCIVITALPYIRRKVFELFYYLHIVLAGSMIICAFFHTGILVPTLAAVTWGFDLTLRKIYMAGIRYPQKAHIKVISDTVVELSFLKTDAFNYNPGQYIYIAIPDISFFQWHPFSLSSSPEQKAVTLHIRKAGAWTSELYELAKRSTEVNILMEGPYGSVGVDIMSDRYKMMMLFSGGIGVTPMQAICNQMMYEHSLGRRQLKKLGMIWIERDPTLMQEVDPVKRMSQYHSSELEGIAGIAEEDSFAGDGKSIASLLSQGQGLAATLLSLVPASATTDQQLANEYPTEEFRDLDEDDDNNDDGRSVVSMLSSLFTGVRRSTRDQKPSNLTRIDDATAEGMSVTSVVRSSSFQLDDEENAGNPKTPKPIISQRDDDTFDQTFLNNAYDFGDVRNRKTYQALDLQVYLTSKNAIDDVEEVPFIRRGRPDIKKIFQQFREQAIAQGEKRVAVCVCAPHRIVSICQKASVKYSDSKVCFDFHHEVFD